MDDLGRMGLKGVSPKNRHLLDMQWVQYICLNWMVLAASPRSWADVLGEWSAKHVYLEEILLARSTTYPTVHVGVISLIASPACLGTLQLSEVAESLASLTKVSKLQRTPQSIPPLFRFRPTELPTPDSLPILPTMTMSQKQSTSGYLHRFWCGKWNVHHGGGLLS